MKNSLNFQTRLYALACFISIALGPPAPGQPAPAPAARQLGDFKGISVVRFTRDGKRILTNDGGSPGVAVLWDIQSGNEIREFAGHTEGINDVVFSPDEKFIATAGGTSHGDAGPARDTTIRLWDVATGREIRQLKLHREATSVHFSPDGKQLLGCGGDRAAYLWDTATGHQPFRLGQLAGDDVTGFETAAFSPDGRTILGTESDCHIWDAVTGKRLCLMPPEDVKVSLFHSAEFSPDGKLVVSASLDKTAQTWDSKTGRQIQLLSGHVSFVFHASFSADSTRIVTASEDKTARVWEAATGKQLQKLDHPGSVQNAIFSPDGKRILTQWIPAENDSPQTPYVAGISLWDAQTGKEIRRLTTHDKQQRPGPMVFTPDGKSILVKLETLQLWDADTGKTIREYK